MPEWMELELAEALRPVSAPPEMWARVQTAARPPRQRFYNALRYWPAAAMAAVLILAGTVWMAAKGAPPALELQRIAQAQLHEQAPLDLRSSDASEINRWMRAQAGVDLRLPQQSRVQLEGARVIGRGGTRVASVIYRVGSAEAALVMLRSASSGENPHGRFALAYADPTHQDAACVICHTAM
jgi:hypothetical protein